MLKDAGMTEKETRAAIDELRKGSKVNSQSAEDNYDALGKVCINLNEGPGTVSWIRDWAG